MFCVGNRGMSLFLFGPIRTRETIRFGLRKVYKGSYWVWLLPSRSSVSTTVFSFFFFSCKISQALVAVLQETMTSTTTKILLALHAAAFILAGSSKFCVMASPVSMSSTRALVANRSLHDQPGVSNVNPPGTAITRRMDLRAPSLTMIAHPSTARPLRRRDSRHYYNLARENYDDLRMYHVTADIHKN